MRRLQTVLGVLLVGLGIYVALFVERRGDMVVIFFTSLGGFLISKSMITEFFRDVWKRSLRR